MKPRFTSLSPGFTLIELTIVMLFISIFSAVALPNLIRQGGKAREVEFKNTVGTINRAQQTYHWEHKVFAQGDTDADSLELLNIRFSPQYIDSYDIEAHSEPLAYATIAPSNVEYQTDQTRAYSGLTLFAEGVYTTLMCQSLLVSQTTPPPTLPPDSDCGTDAERVR